MCKQAQFWRIYGRCSLSAAATIGLAQVGMEARSGGPRILPCSMCSTGFSFGARPVEGSLGEAFGRPRPRRAPISLETR